jgi:hypothetical protein
VSKQRLLVILMPMLRELISILNRNTITTLLAEFLFPVLLLLVKEAILE